MTGMTPSALASPFPHLFSPFRLGGQTSRDRMVMPVITAIRADAFIDDACEPGAMTRGIYAAVELAFLLNGRPMTASAISLRDLFEGDRP